MIKDQKAESNRIFYKGNIIFFNKIPMICEANSTIKLPIKSNSDWRRLTDEEFKGLLGGDIEPISVGYQPNINNYD